MRKSQFRAMNRNTPLPQFPPVPFLGGGRRPCWIDTLVQGERTWDSAIRPKNGISTGLISQKTCGFATLRS